MKDRRKFVETVALTKLYREEWFELIKQYTDKIREKGAETFGFADIWEEVMKLRTDADTVLHPIAASSMTPEIRELDKKRDDLFRSLRENVKSFEKHYEIAKSDAAKKIMIIFNAYGDPTNKSKNEETAIIYNLIADLRTKYNAELTILNLLVWVTELDKANKEFNNKWVERGDEKAAEEVDIDFAEVQAKLDYLYDLMMWSLEYRMYIGPNEDVKILVKQWNEILKEYKTVLSARETRNENKKEDEEGLEQ